MPVLPETGMVRSAGAGSGEAVVLAGGPEAAIPAADLRFLLGCQFLRAAGSILVECCVVALGGLTPCACPLFVM
ncbi:hypothetical protein GCM10018987_54160 [Streptomyces cremeus]